MTTLLVTHAQPLQHVPPEAHAERPERLAVVQARLRELDQAGFAWREPEPAPREAVLAVHAATYVDSVERACASGPGWFDADTYSAGRATLDAANLACGAALLACDEVLTGKSRNAFCAMRPPGHHAERDRAMGFCIWNVVAVAARHAQRTHGLERVFVLDWDVHHGNGTQHLFEHDPSVFYASLHQAPLYPGTGSRSERGVGAGEGTTLNCPQPAGAGPAEWSTAMETEVLPALAAFEPELVLVSAGFDAHRADPLAQTQLETETFGRFTELVCAAAAAACGGRVVSVLEGGYDLAALADSVEAHVEALRAS